MTDTHELAWAAGFFDGEGHIRYKRGARTLDPKRYTWKNIILEVAQVDRRALDRFQLAVNCGKVYGPYRNRAVWRPQWQLSYRFVLSSFYEIERVIGLLWPYLGEVKRAQAQAALDGWRNEPRLRPGKKPGVRLVPTCHPERPHRARMMCTACYKKFLLSRTAA